MPIGYLDEITQLGILRGWARPYKDRSPRHIEIYADGKLAGECKADALRSDVNQRLKITPNCGIHFDLSKINFPENANKHQEIIITAKCKRSKNYLSGTHSISAASALKQKAFKEKYGIASNKHLAGIIHIDNIDMNGRITGWSNLELESNKKTSITSVKAFIDETLIGEGLSNLPREDVASEKGISKECGFSFYLNVSDYCMEHSLRADTQPELSLIASRSNGDAFSEMR